MVQLTNPLALHMLSQRKRWTDPGRMDSIASLFLLFTSGNPDLFSAAFEGLKQKRFKVDSKLLSDLYASCPMELKLALAETPAFSRLEPSTFNRLFRDAWSIKTQTASQRHSLLYRLGSFLAWNPERGNEYTDIILEGLRSKRWHALIPGYSLAGYLDDLPEEELMRMKRSLVSARWELRMTAHNGLCMLVKRRREVSPTVAAFCLSPDIEATARRIQKSDPNEDVRLCAFYLVKALREARRDVRASYTPPKPKASRGGGRRPSGPR